MEINTAILIADLSGYTALTEAHGAVSAADLIDRYTGIVENCLVGDSILHERVGDEIMIVSTSADTLLSTALMILQTAAAEQHFLQLHGGLHYGKLLKRDNSYFGTALNLASRIAAKANAGSFWCSKEFANALSGESTTLLQPKGKAAFKNINGETELFEFLMENKPAFAVDPVCRMLLQHKEKAIPHPGQPGIFFCSKDCLDIFIKNEQ